MIKSMTGYGRSQKHLLNRDILLEIRSVNNRYFDYNVRLPRLYGYLEDKLKNLAQGSISRGKVEISLSMFNADAGG